MLRSIITYLLLLSFLFLGGNGSLSAQAQQTGSLYIPAKSKTQAALAGLGLSHFNSEVSLKAFPTKVDKANDKFAFTENQVEEEEVENYEELLGSYLSLSSLFSGIVCAFLLGNIKQILLFCRQISFFSYHKWFLLFRVFRI